MVPKARWLREALGHAVPCARLAGRTMPWWLLLLLWSWQAQTVIRSWMEVRELEAAEWHEAQQQQVREWWGDRLWQMAASRLVSGAEPSGISGSSSKKPAVRHQLTSAPHRGSTQLERLSSAVPVHEELLWHSLHRGLELAAQHVMR